MLQMCPRSHPGLIRAHIEVKQTKVSKAKWAESLSPWSGLPPWARQQPQSQSAAGQLRRQSGLLPLDRSWQRDLPDERSNHRRPYPHEATFACWRISS